MGQCANIRTRTLLPTSSTGSGLPLGSCTFVSISFFHWHKPPPHVMQENTHGKRTANRPTYALHSSKGLGARHIEYQQGTEGVLVVNLSRAQRFSFTWGRVQARPHHSATYTVDSAEAVLACETQQEWRGNSWHAAHNED